MFQLNLDGQQVTQKISGGFGQPRFSRESIAEFQIITNLFDITQGRSAGMQVQAISRSGTNNNAGQRLRLLPRRRAECARSDDQDGAAVSEPADRRHRSAGRSSSDKLHYFASYEYEREPGTDFSAAVGAAGAELHDPVPATRRRACSARVDQQLSTKNRLTVRGTRWDWANPFVLVAGGHPSNASVQTKQATNVARHLVAACSATRACRK